MSKKSWKTQVMFSCLLLGAGVLASTSLASAEQQVDEEIVMSEQETREIVVSATRTEMEVKDAPSSVIVITREQIEERQANTLGDVLRDVLGIYVPKTGSIGNTVLNPMRIRGSEGRHVLILVDGRRVGMDPNTPNQRELERIHLGNVERVEIIKGSSSALYGSDAIGGVINIITRKPDRDILELSASYRLLEGEGDLHNSQGIYFQAAKRGSFSWSLAAKRNYINELRLDSGVAEYPHGYELPIDLKGVWEFRKNHRIEVDLSYLRESVESDSTTYEDTDQKNERYGYSLGYTGKKGKTDWQFRVYHNRYEKDYRVNNNLTKTPQSFDLMHNNTSIAEGRITHSLNDQHLLTGGFELRYDQIKGTRIEGKYKTEVRGSLSEEIGKQSDQGYAFYLQDEWTPSEKWLVIPAIRFDKTEGYESSITPRLGATYFYRSDLRFKMNLATGFAAPSLAQRYTNWLMGNRPTMITYLLGNPDLDPEKSVSGEISIEKDWKNHTLKVSVYRNEVEDLINSYQKTFRPPVMGRPIRPGYQEISYRNIDNAVIQGIEVSSTHKISKELDFKLGWSYIDAKNDDTKERLEGRPRNQITFGATYQAVNSPWKFSLDGNFMQDLIYLYGISGDSREEPKTFLIANAMIERKIGTRSTVYLGIENLFDKKDYGMFYFGRSYLFGMNYKF